MLLKIKSIQNERQKMLIFFTIPQNGIKYSQPKKIVKMHYGIKKQAINNFTGIFR